MFHYLHKNGFAGAGMGKNTDLIAPLLTCLRLFREKVVQLEETRL